MKKNLIALLILLSSPILAMDSEGKPQETTPKSAAQFTVTPEFQPGQSLYQRYKSTGGDHDHNAFERYADELYKNPNAIPPCNDDDLLASSHLNVQCSREASNALDKALGPCQKSSLLSSQVISQTIGIGTSRGAGAYVHPDLHEHFHDKAMTRGDLHLFVMDDEEFPDPSSSHDLGQKKSTDSVLVHMEQVRTSYAWLFKQIKEEYLQTDGAFFPMTYDLGQEKCIETVRAAIEKDTQEDDVLVIDGHACSSASNIIYPQQIPPKIIRSYHNPSDALANIAKRLEWELESEVDKYRITAAAMIELFKQSDDVKMPKIEEVD